MELTDKEWERYARHIILDEVGEAGQKRLLASQVLIVGGGGLGSPLALYLAAAGIGTIGIIDDDKVELSNLQRQIVHDEANIGRAKTQSLAASLARFNSDIKIVTHEARLMETNAREILTGYDLIADGSDNFLTRYLINDMCFHLKKTWVSAALSRFEGQLSVFKPYLGSGHPCYRCLYPDMPPSDLIPRCEEAGILGSIAGVMGSLQATEILKEILGLGESLSGRLMLYDALTPAFTMLKIRKNPDCLFCALQTN